MSIKLSPSNSNPGSLTSELYDSSKTNVTAIQRTAIPKSHTAETAFSVIAKTSAKSVSEHLSYQEEDLQPLEDETIETLTLEKIDSEDDITSTSLSPSPLSFPALQPILTELNGVTLTHFPSSAAPEPTPVNLSTPIAISSSVSTNMERKKDLPPSSKIPDELTFALKDVEERLKYNYNPFNVSDDGFEDALGKETVDQSQNSEFSVSHSTSTLKKAKEDSETRTRRGRPPEAGEKTVAPIFKFDSTKSLPPIDAPKMSKDTVSIEEFVKKGWAGLQEATQMRFGKRACFGDLMIQTSPFMFKNAYGYLEKANWTEAAYRHVYSSLFEGACVCYGF